MPTNPSQRLRRSYLSSPSSPSSSSPPSSPKRGTHGNKTVSAIMDELATDERSTDEETMNDQTTNERLINEQLINDQSHNDQSTNERLINEQLINDQSTNDQSTNDRSTNGRSLNKQPTNGQITDEANGDGIKNQAVTDGMRTNAPVTDRSVTNTEVGDPHGIVPSRLAKFFAWALVLLAFLSPFLRPPTFVLSVVRFLKALLLKLNLINTLSPILVTAGCVCLGLRLLYALCQDFMALLIVLRPVAELLKASYRYFLALSRAMFQDIVTLLDFLLTKFNAMCQRLLVSLITFYRSVLALFRQLHLAMAQLSTLSQHLLTWLSHYSRVWKWMLVTCAVLLSGTYTVTLTLQHNPGLLSEVICPIPVVGLYLPPCQPTACPQLLLQEIWSSNVISPQDVFATIMGRLGQDHNLASQLIKHHSAVRDLGIRVKGSKLQHKHEIAEALESLKEHTRATGRSLHQFTTRFTTFVDLLHGFDKYALRLIEDRINSDGRNEIRRLMSRILEALYPLTGFQAHRPIDEDIKEVFRITTGHMAEHINTLVDHADTLLQEIEVIQRFLETVKGNAEKDIEKLPTRDILGALWDRLAPGDKYGYLYVSKDTRELLADLINLYEVASNVVGDIHSALLRVQVELQHFDTTRFQNDLLLEQYPLEVMAASLRNSMNNLAASKQVLRTGGGTKIVETIRPDKNTKKTTK